MGVVAEVEPRPARAGLLSVRQWALVGVAALAMVATLPGRTHGLGLITEPLLADLHIGREDFAALNLWATLLGALFCLPCGWLIDRLGIRRVFLGIVLSLGGVVVVMSRLSAEYAVFSVGVDLFLLVLLTRGFGQSALSVVSLTTVGRAAQRSALAMGVYACLVSIGFMAAFKGIGVAFQHGGHDWRTVWAAIGWALICCVAPFALLTPTVQQVPSSREEEHPTTGKSLGQALRDPTFWVFAVGTSLYGLITSGVSLFNQSILAERHFNRDTFLEVTPVAPLVGLAGNLMAGWLAQRWGLARILTAALLLLSASLCAFRWISTETELYLYVVAYGLAGGMVTTVFFGAWPRYFGQRQLGRIQGAAQMLTVLASAVGPLLFAASKERLGSYVPLFFAGAAMSALLAACAWLIRGRDESP
jgi:MFS family permease